MGSELAITYFAYGSNMVRAQMAHRCPGATVAGNALLRDYRFVINARTYATVVPDPGHVVHGVLWKMSLQHEVSLDRYESVAKGHYIKGTVELDLPEGEVVSAVTYFATNNKPGRPRAPYIHGILESAVHFQFPAEYMQVLRQWV